MLASELRPGDKFTVEGVFVEHGLPGCQVYVSLNGSGTYLWPTTPVTPVATPAKVGDVVTDLDDLPAGTVLIDCDGDAWQQNWHADEYDWVCGNQAAITSIDNFQPLTVVWIPPLPEAVDGCSASPDA